MIDTKVCSRCKLEKPAKEFFLHKVGRKKGKLFSACRSCESKRQKASRAVSAVQPKIAPSRKICRVCQEDKPIEHFGFWRTTPDGRNHRCKECCANYSYSTDTRSASTTASKLKLSVAEVKAIKEAMTTCEVCGRSKDEAILCIDHNHDTGQMRGILCKQCNSGLGFLGDSLDLVLSMVEYLRQHD